MEGANVLEVGGGWMERLVAAAAAKTGSYLAMVFPKDDWWVKLGMRVGDLFESIRGDYVPAYVHPVAEIESVAGKGGLALRHSEPRLAGRGFRARRLREPAPIR